MRGDLFMLNTAQVQQVEFQTPWNTSQHLSGQFYHIKSSIFNNLWEPWEEKPEKEHWIYLPLSSGKVLLYLCTHVLLNVLIWSCTARDPVVQTRKNKRWKSSFRADLCASSVCDCHGLLHARLIFNWITVTDCRMCFISFLLFPFFFQLWLIWV